jgi:hypothetical protein
MTITRILVNTAAKTMMPNNEPIKIPRLGEFSEMKLI